MHRVAALLLSAVLLCAGSAAADSIGPTCAGGSCQDGIYWLTYELIGGDDDNSQTFRITFRMNTAEPDIDGVYGVDSVAVKITDNLMSGDIFNAPEGAANWNDLEDSGLSEDG